MSEMKNWMMDVETFCDGYYHGGMNDFTVGEVVDDVEMFFRSNEATKHAKRYLTEKLGEE